VSFDVARSTTLENNDSYDIAEEHATRKNEIELTSQGSSPCCVAADGKNRPDSVPQFPWLNSNQLLRSGNFGDEAERVRNYASPRHCYRVPLKQPLLRSLVLNRNVPTREIAVFAPGNSRPPIREPNMTPEKSEKKKDRQKKKKKPVIHTVDNESTDSKENRTMAAEDNPSGDSETFRCEWGVKLTEPSETHNNEKQYVTKRLWGVSLKQPKQDNPVSTTFNSAGNAEELAQNDSAASTIEETDEERWTKKKNEMLAGNMVETNGKNLERAAAEYLSNISRASSSARDADGTIGGRQETGDDTNNVVSYKQRKARDHHSSSHEMIMVDNDFNVPLDGNANTELAAWKNLVMRSRAIAMPEKMNFLLTDHVENLQMVSIRPEAPEPKRDVQVVPSVDKNNNRAGQEFKRFESADMRATIRQSDPYSPGKNLHTASWQIRYIHCDTKSIIQSKLLPVSLVSVDAASAAFSTESERTFIKKMILGKTSRDHMVQRQQEVKDEKQYNDDSLSDQPESQILLHDEEDKEEDMAVTNVMRENSDEETISLDQSSEDSPKTTNPRSQKFAKNRSYLESDNAQDEMEFRKDDKDLKDDVSSDETSDQLRTIINSKVGSNQKQRSSLKEEHFDEMDVAKEESDDSGNHVTSNDYLRLPGDPYPYNKEYLDNWRAMYFKDMHYMEKIAPRATAQANDSASFNLKSSSETSPVMDSQSESRNETITTTEIPTRGFRVFRKWETPASYQEDAADALGMQQWTEAFSRLDSDEKTSETVRVVDDDNASYHR
jgi:hypothetical protein